MTRKKWIAIGVVGALAGLGVGAYSYAPTYVEHQIEFKYPGVKVDHLRLGRAGIELDGIHIQRDWVTGTIDRAFVTWDKKTIEAHGGDITVDLDKKSESGVGGGQRKITADGLTVHVNKGNSSASVDGVSFRDSTVSFEGGTFKWKNLSGTFKDGSVRLPEKHATVSSASVAVDARHLSKSPVILQGIDVDLREMTASVQTVDLVAIDPKDQTFPVTLHEVHAQDVDSLVDVRIDSVDVTHPWINPSKVTFHKIGATVNRNLDFSSGLNVSVGQVSVHIDPTNLEFSGKASCQQWAEALPDGLHDGPLQSPSFTGDLDFDVRLKPSPKVKITSSCKMDCTVTAALKKPFKYMAYNAKNEPIERTAGPGSPGWVSLMNVTPDMPTAVINMEDPGFPYHKGYVLEAYENSFGEDLKKGAFARGGSTITMQLAKNLWLNRHKTLGRKAEELLLTMGLESCLSKDQIMELYLNVVEFGPDLYGVGPAAHHYFHTGPFDLEPDQAFYLASILPNPKKAPPPNGPTMDRIKSLMKILAKNGRIPDSMLLEVTPSETDDPKPVDTSGWQ